MATQTTPPTPNPPPSRHLLRFDAFDRGLHGVLMISFLGLALTGLPLLFSREAWAARLARVFGGFEYAGGLHRLFALAMIVVFVTHLIRLGRRILIRHDYGLLWGPGSLVPQPRDAFDLWNHMRWFVGLGPRPRFDRFTYWEKFDYWAVFWGMAIIGGSGFILWFPEAFATFLPGWMFNLAMIIHGEEALLAVGFIFTIHFFNSHLRPEKFPMDMVIFTGRVTEAELKHERPNEYARLEARGQLDALEVSAPSPILVRRGRIIGSLAVTIGLILVGLIAFALVGGH